MNHKRSVQFAVMCLQALDDNAGKPLSTEEISRKQGIPRAECWRIVQKLSRAGIVAVVEARKVVLLRPVDELTTLEILEAVWAVKKDPPLFRMWVGGARGPRMRKTLAWVTHAQAQDAGIEING